MILKDIKKRIVVLFLAIMMTFMSIAPGIQSVYASLDNYSYDNSISYINTKESLEQEAKFIFDIEPRIYSSKYALSAITFCGDCGDIYRRTYWNIHGRKEFVWHALQELNKAPKYVRTEQQKKVIYMMPL